MLLPSPLPSLPLPLLLHHRRTSNTTRDPRVARMNDDGISLSTKAQIFAYLVCVRCICCKTKKPANAGGAGEPARRLIKRDVLVLGLDGAGKSTLLQRMQNPETFATPCPEQVATTGLNIKDAWVSC